MGTCRRRKLLNNSDRPKEQQEEAKDMSYNVVKGANKQMVECER